MSPLCHELLFATTHPTDRAGQPSDDLHNFRLKYPVMGPLELTEEQEADLRRLLGVYKRETERCRKAKAYLAGCVISGAELETALLMMVNAFPDEATATGKVPCGRSR
jgi:hypothetical protein